MAPHDCANIIGLVLALTAFEARAQEPEAPATFPLVPAVDASVLTIGVGLLALPPFLVSELDPPHCGTSTTPLCDPMNLNDIDRTAVNACLDGDCNFGDSEESAVASDVLLYATPVIAAGLHAIDVPSFGWRAWVEDVVIMGEVAMISGGFQQLMSLAVRRPRPYLYSPGLRDPDTRDGPGAAQSFFSGHASTVFGVATSFAYITTRRRPQMEHKWAIWAGAMAFAAPLPVLRVAAGSHFWSDTLAGIVVGVSTGLVIPYLHEEQRNRDVAVVLTGGPRSLGISGVF
jgi:membrane-associated phospholipid phosphatase